MTISSVSAHNFPPQLYEGLSSDTKPTVGVQSFAQFKETDTGDVFEFSGASWGPLSNIPRSAVRVSSGTYNATNTYTTTILVPGTGTLTLSPVSGVTDIVYTAAEVSALGAGYVIELECDSITLGNADMEVLVTIPS